MKKFICVCLVLCVLLLNACTVGEPSITEDKAIVAASFYPVYIFTLNLLDGVEGVEVRCMAEQSVGCLHDYTLTAKDAKLLSDARILVINGAGMEGFLDDALKSVDDLKIIDSSVGAKLICAEEHTQEEETHGEHSHHHEDNSHIWLSVDNAEIQVENIKNGLVKEFPEYGNAIEKNYSKYIEILKALKTERDTLIPLTGSLSVVSFHGAYEYLATDTGFEIKATVESDEGDDPSAKELAFLSSEILNENVKALFVGPDYSGSGAEILSNETNVKTFILDPFTSGELSLTAYEDAMSENYKNILKAVR